MSSDWPVASTLLAGRYRLVSLLETGGMAEVWRAVDELLDRPVAVKLPTGPQVVWREARLAARLSHPGIAAVHDYREAIRPDGAVVPFVVMELLDGDTVAARVDREPFGWAETARIGAAVADALAAAHASGVVHRDIKPGNVMLTANGVKILDFGISVAAGEPDEDDTGATFGTPAYVAPERLDGMPAAPATDVYGLGVLLFEMVTGDPPYPVETWEELAAARAVGPSTLPPSLPADFRDVVARCLHDDPDERPTAARVRADLLAVALRSRPAEPDAIDGAALPAAVLEPAVDLAAAFLGRAQHNSRGVPDATAGLAQTVTGPVALEIATDGAAPRRIPTASAAEAALSPAPDRSAHVTPAVPAHTAFVPLGLDPDDFPQLGAAAAALDLDPADRSHLPADLDGDRTYLSDATSTGLRHVPAAAADLDAGDPPQFATIVDTDHLAASLATDIHTDHLRPEVDHLPGGIEVERGTGRNRFRVFPLGPPVPRRPDLDGSAVPWTGSDADVDGSPAVAPGTAADTGPAPDDTAGYAVDTPSGLGSDLDDAVTAAARLNAAPATPGRGSPPLSLDGSPSGRTPSGLDGNPSGRRTARLGSAGVSAGLDQGPVEWNAAPAGFRGAQPALDEDAADAPAALHRALAGSGRPSGGGVLAGGGSTPTKATIPEAPGGIPAPRENRVSFAFLDEPEGDFPAPVFAMTGPGGAHAETTGTLRRTRHTGDFAPGRASAATVALHPPPRRRVVAGVGAAALATAVLGTLVALVWRHRDPTVEAAPAPSATFSVLVAPVQASPTPRGTGSASPSPAPALSFTDAVSRMRAAVQGGIEAGQIRQDVGTDLLNLLHNLTNTKGGDRAVRLDMIRRKLYDRIREGSVAATRGAILQSRLADVDRALAT